jgi:predicted DNA-binding protein
MELAELTTAHLKNTIAQMSYKLGKPRTVRFSAELDKKLSALAAHKGKTVSEIIRDSVIHDLENGEKTASDWILEVAKSPIPKRRLNQEFIKAYEKRHS